MYALLSARKLSTATQPQFPRTVIRLRVEHVELNGVAQIEKTAMQLQRNSRKAEKLKSQATEQASLLTDVLPRRVLVSGVLTCFCDSFVSFDGKKG
jgi:hypothetical protein